MKLYFESWIERQGINGSAKGFFEEAITCFKVSAYRGAYMLTYLGFQTLIRERLLLSDPPSSNLLPNQLKWTETLKKLRDSTQWDTEVNRLIAVDNSGVEKNIFMINRDVRKEAMYFKDKRNACVHGKDLISYPNVESLWMFIQNHSGKFMVNSGIEGYIQQVKLHFNPIENDPRSDFSELLNRIANVVHDDQYEEFFTKLYRALPLHYRSEDFVKRFWYAIANSDDHIIRENFIQYLNKNIVVFSEFVHTFPDLLRFFSDTETTLRKYWNNYLPKTVFYSESKDKLYDITHWLLENNKVPDSEREDFWQLWIKNKTLGWLYQDFSKEMIILLENYGYVQAYRSYILSKSTAWHYRESWYSQEQLLPLYLAYFELDSEFVEHINKALGNVYEGSFTDAVSKVIHANGCRVGKIYNEICEKLQIKSYFGNMLEETSIGSV